MTTTRTPIVGSNQSQRTRAVTRPQKPMEIASRTLARVIRYELTEPRTAETAIPTMINRKPYTPPRQQADD